MLRACALACLLYVAIPAPALAAPSHDVLARIRAAIRREAASTRLPIIVFDIDGTIMDNRSRTTAILRDFIAVSGDSAANIAESIARLKSSEVDYYLVDTFKKIGVKDMFLLESALDFWSDRFFSNEYVEMDIPLPGAVEFITEMHASGAFIVYLTGRDLPTMLEGTLIRLKTAGFPIGTERSMLIMKPVPKSSGSDYKMRMMPAISRLGKVVAAFENEPAHANLMKHAWPEAEVVLIKSPHTRAAPIPMPGVKMIDKYPK